MPQTPEHGQMLLTLTDLACRRGDRILWRGLSAHVRGGEALHITGANGIGKSSLLRIIGGLLPAAHGSVAAHAPMALIDEQHALDPSLSVLEALRFWARLDGLRADAVADRVAAALAAMGIGHLADVPVRFLSTGQRKRAAMARLVTSGAPLWLLDEPANGLDADGLALLESLIAGHMQGGGGAIIASHLALSVPGLRCIALAEHAV